MIRKREPPASLVRSSAAEYLTFVVASGTGGVEAFYADESAWAQPEDDGAALQCGGPTINCHLKRVFGDSEIGRGQFLIKPGPSPSAGTWS